MQSIKKALAWLVAAQDQDGGWHSESYGALRGGAAVTSLVLYAVAGLPEEFRLPHLAALKRGYAFLRPGIKKQGCVACPDGSLDFPVYASPLVLTATRRITLDATEAERKTLTDFIVASQLAEPRGFKPGDRHFGGWDLMGNTKVVGLTSDTNVSLAAYALEALAGIKEASVVKTQMRARDWLAGCQNNPGDGGFRFSPDPGSLNNKAEWTNKEQTHPRSYGSATADGLRAMIASGVAPADKRATAALKWLIDRPEIDEVPGFADLPPENDWKLGLLYYYYASLARCLGWFPETADRDVPLRKARREALLAKILKLQSEDGRWQNDSSRMREDDPLIATSLALSALGALAAG